MQPGEQVWRCFYIKDKNDCPVHLSWLFLNTQLLLHISQEVALSALSYLSESWDEMASALLRALSRCHQAGQFTLMQEISRLLLPKGK